MTTAVLSADAQATALLVGRFGMGPAKPLSRADFNRVAQSLHQRGMRPADLFRQVPADLPVDEVRLNGLIARGTALALAVDGWDQQGIRVVSRGDGDYPTRFRRLLKGGSAPILYYAGDLTMLDRPSIGVVGSRDATDAGLRFARGLGERAAHEDVVMVSGDARGIDRTAMEAALDAGGKVIGLLSDSLSKSVLSKRYRRAIGEGRVLLVSHVEPDARFTVGQAMERNRYIYAASDAVVIADSAEKGGTWNGALENAKHGWTPAYVRTGQDMRDGGHALICQGMLELSDEWLADTKSIVSLFEGRMASANVLPLFDKSAPGPSAEPPAEAADERDVLFAVFTERLAAMIEKPLTTDAIARRFGIEINQAEKWLQRASDVGGIVTANGEHWAAP